MKLSNGLSISVVLITLTACSKKNDVTDQDQKPPVATAEGEATGGHTSEMPQRKAPPKLSEKLMVEAIEKRANSRSPHLILNNPYYGFDYSILPKELSALEPFGALGRRPVDTPKKIIVRDLQEQIAKLKNYGFECELDPMAGLGASTEADENDPLLRGLTTGIGMHKPSCTIIPPKSWEPRYFVRRVGDNLVKAYRIADKPVIKVLSIETGFRDANHPESIKISEAGTAVRALFTCQWKPNQEMLQFIKDFGGGSEYKRINVIQSIGGLDGLAGVKNSEEIEDLSATQESAGADKSRIEWDWTPEFGWEERPSDDEP